MKAEDLEKYRTDFEIIRETANQLLKDFSLAGFEVEFSGNELMAYDELKSQITPILWDLFQNHPEQFQNLLYRIDINEKQLMETLKLIDPLKISGALSDLILQREFQKVIMRRFFS
ncbi:MAG: hypothetical protein KA444_03070 [Bacteroidia bacterium]|nr:hypothetical protein [Bacteroidia bacterium]